MSLEALGREVEQAYVKNQRVLAFDTYYQMALQHPERHARTAAQYLCDVFQHYGTRLVDSPRGKLQRFVLFDAPFDDGRDALIGHEEVQQRVFRALQNFVRDGRVNRLLLLHGPNGSAKSTFVSCVQRAMEHYSTLDVGAVYRFNWVFPSQKLGRGIGFGGGPGAPAPSGEGGAYASFALLDDENIDARLCDELRDHPLLLVPTAQRKALLEQHLKDPTFVLGDYLLRGDLNPKNRQIYEALLTAYKGDLLKVLRHVQVERVYFQHRYRAGLVTVEAQLAVDAHSRQLTMNRSFAALPAALQSVSLHEYAGDLVDANRGMIEYADLLKRPVEAYKYLLSTVEDALVSVDSTTLALDCVFIGSSNETHLAVFKEIPEFQSFKGRMELIRMGYLLDYEDETRIYSPTLQQRHFEKHVAPHTAFVTAFWAVLTRMRKPLPDKYDKSLAEIVARLGPLEKADLYARRVAPVAFTAEQSRDLLANLDKIWGESDTYPNYEGRTGASPRELKFVLLSASQNPRYPCLSPLAVLDELDELVKNVSVYEFLKQEPLSGGFHENRRFVQTARDRYLDRVDDEVRSSMGLVDESRYSELLSRYITHVSHWVKKEKLRNPTTGRLEDPDLEMMTEVEKTLGVEARRDDFRNEAIARIGAWSIEHPGRKIDYAEVFPRHVRVLRESYFDQRKKQVGKRLDHVLSTLVEGHSASTPLDGQAEAESRATIENLKQRFGYCDKCCKEALGSLFRHRYSA